MRGRSKSQWVFGELFPPEAARKVHTVSELTSTVRRLLETQVGMIWVCGEVSNLRVQSSGHAYFSLKDEGAQLACVLFRGESGVDRRLLKDGRRLLLQGELTVYEPRGQYQLRATAVELQGVGALQLAFEQLKQKLQAEGLFAVEHKRALPEYPRRIGLVTSPTGAALRDVIHVIARRDASLEVVLVPCRVQGDGAAEEIAQAIRWLNEIQSQLWRGGSVPGLAGALDVILITRGGGSLEDLWAFNEEVVARAIYGSALPVVSAVGHEIDFTISDFVADVRAATPSAAAEILTEGVYASRQWINEAEQRLGRMIRDAIRERAEEVGDWVERLGRSHPRRQLDARLQRLDDLGVVLSRALAFRWRESQAAGKSLLQRLKRLRPGHHLRLRTERHLELVRRLSVAAARWVEHGSNALKSVETRLRLLSPEQTLARGYSITTDARSGRLVRRSSDVQPGQRLRTRLRQGEILSDVAS